jgi:hypothetical protein
VSIFKDRDRGLTGAGQWCLLLAGGLLFGGVAMLGFGFLLRPFRDCGGCPPPMAALAIGLVLFLPGIVLGSWLLGFAIPRRVLLLMAALWVPAAVISGYEAHRAGTVAAHFPPRPELLAFLPRGAGQPPGDLRPKVLICDEKGGVESGMMLSLPPRLRAADWSEVRTIVRLRREYVTIGRYTDGSSAQRIRITASAIDIPSRILLREQAFEGGAPSERVRTGGTGLLSGSRTGSAPAADEILAWIESLDAVRP